MSVPPLLMRVHVEAPGHRPLRLWLPLAVLWPVLLLLTPFVLAATVVADIVLLAVGARYHRYTLLLIRCLDFVRRARGAEIRVNGSRSIVELAIL